MSYLSSHLDMYKNSSKGVESSCTAINVEAAFTITNKKDTLIEGENSPPNDEVVTKSNGELHGDWLVVKRRLRKNNDKKKQKKWSIWVR